MINYAHMSKLNPYRHAGGTKNSDNNICDNVREQKIIKWELDD